MAEDAEEEQPAESQREGLPRVALTEITGGDRYRALNMYDSHYFLTQDNDKLYDWDGYMIHYGRANPISPGVYVPMSQRRPSVFMPVARFIVSRLTSMMMGVDSEPRLTVEGDENAEHYVRTLAEESGLFVRFIEARDLGGACGSVAVSYGFVDGRPRIEVHNAKHCWVTSWDDRAELRVGSMIKAYSYTEVTLEEGSSRPKEDVFWYARYIDGERDMVWERVPEHFAADPDWARILPPDRETPMVGGMCPVIWIQNRPQTASAEHPRAPHDGPSDYEGMCDALEELHRLRSSASKGTKANTEPTLVIRAEQRHNTAPVRKGSGVSIFAEGGADYLSLPGDAMAAARDMMREIRSDVLDSAGVVAPSFEDVAASAKSAAALRIIYAPMTSVCELLRASYGQAMERVLKGLLRQAKALPRDAVQLPKQHVREPADDGNEEAEPTSLFVVPVPGNSEEVRVVWPPFFSPTWTDKQIAVETAKSAAGGRSVISHRTAVQSVSQLFGVEDPDQEMESIEEDSERGIDMEMRAFEARQPMPDEEEDEPGQGARADGGPATDKTESDGG